MPKMQKNLRRFSSKPKCSAVTKKGKPCGNYALEGSKYCSSHKNPIWRFIKRNNIQIGILVAIAGVAVPICAILDNRTDQNLRQEQQEFQEQLLLKDRQRLASEKLNEAFDAISGKEYSSTMTDFHNISDVQLEKAKRLFHEAAQLSPNHEKLDVIRALLELAQNRPSSAETICRQSNRADAKMVLGYILRKKGHLDLAIKACEEAVSKSGGDPMMAANLGLIYSEAGQDDRGKELLNATAENHPRNYWVHVNLGRVLMKTGDLDEAVVHLRSAVKLNPNGRAGHFYLGQAFSKRDESAADIQAAMEHYERAIQIDPKAAPAYYFLGFLMLRTGEIEIGVQNIRKACELEDAVSSVAGFGTALLLMHDPNEAFEIIRDASILHGEHPFWFALMGLARAQCGEYGEAEKEFRNADRINPDHAGTLFYLGLTLSELGRIEDAISTVEQALTVDPNLGLAHHVLADLHNTLGDQALAKKHRREYERLVSSPENTAWLDMLPWDE